jgi:L-fuconolactonase
VKVGGIGMARYGGGWEKNPAPPSSQELADYWGDELRFVIETFGPNRCMFESNFPVDRSSCNYVTLWNCLKIVADQYSESEKHDLFFGTANLQYKLGL